MKYLLVAVLFVFACSDSSSSAPDDAGGGVVVSPQDAGTQADGSVPSDAEATDDATLADTGPIERSGVELIDGELFVDGAPFFIQGVAWSPVARGNTLEQIDFAGYVEQDAPLMEAAGFNVVRTYSAITDRAVLDALHARGIYVLNSVYAYGGEPAEAARSRVEAVADHPAILMWVIGNEWNYNGLYVGLSPQESIDRLNEVASIIREVDDAHPIVAVYGELPPVETIDAMPLVDVWGINSYRGISFYDLFEEWSTRSDKPMILAEFGADAWNANIPAEDQAAQADATVALIAEIGANRPSAGGQCLGGAVFEWADEWWKDSEGSPSEHDVGGIAPGGGPHPDQTFNEEWWGLVDIDRNPREVYERLPQTW